jgi:hypothetical protein
MNDNQELQLTYNKVLGIAWVVMAVGSVLYLILGLIFNQSLWYAWTLSYVLGAMVNFFTFNLLRNNVMGLTGDVKSGISSGFSNYVIRIAAYAFIVYIAFKNDTLNPYVVATGFLTIRIAIYIYSYRNKT